jgi:hypothetical protein
VQRSSSAVKTTWIGLALGATVAIAAAAPAAAVTLKTVKGFPTKLDGAVSSDRVYDVEFDVSVFCGGQSGTPIAAGWTDAGVLIHSIDDQYDSVNDYLEISPRLPMKTATIRPWAICAKGAVKATVKTAKGKGPVNCGSKLAIGMPLSSTWPYNDERAVVSKPVGKHKWSTDAPFSDTRAVCVAASAFGKVKAIKRTASFAAGRTSAKVSATCPGARRPIAWGYSAPLMTGNTWESSESDSALAVPFVSGSAPKGKQGWSLVFRTPDAKPAAAAAQVGIHLTCAVPK